MKKLHVLCAVFAALSCPLFGQSFTPAAGYSATELFRTPNESVLGLEFDGAANAYYLVGDGFAGNTRLERRSPGDNYTSPAVLFNYGAPVYGSFVKLDGGRLFFGENTSGTIRVHDIALGSTATLATVPGNYELALGGGTGWLSANPGGFTPLNKLFKLDLGTGATTEVLASADYSGPVAVDGAGHLYYGATAFGVGGNIYKYSQAEANAGGLSLDAGHLWAANGGNSYFDLDATMGLFQTDFATVKVYDLATGLPTPVGSTPHSVGNLAAIPGGVGAVVTNFGTSTSAVFAVVPEPSAVLLLVGAAGLALRRRRA